MAEGEIVADGPTPEIVLASPAFAPQVAKILAPLPYLTVAEVDARARRGRWRDERLSPVATAAVARSRSGCTGARSSPRRWRR